jgi:hypothetical protein
MHRFAVITSLAIALVAAACSDDGSSTTTDTPGSTPTSAATSTSASVSEEEPPTTTTAPAVLTASAPGVTESEIHLGFLAIDFDTLRELGLVDIDRGDFQVVVDAFVDDLNGRGGINGRSVVAHVESVSPVDLVAADAGCLRLTEDLSVFAVIGGYVGPTSTANACFTRDHDTTMIGGAPTPEERAEATAPWISTVIGPARHLEAALRLMADADLFGDRVGVAWDETEQEEAESFVLPTLDDLGIEVAESFVQGTSGGDAVAGAIEWQRFSEVIDTEGIDTMVMMEVTANFGLQQLISNGYEGRLLVVDTISITGSIGSGSTVELAELEGIIGTGWLDSPEAWEQDITQHCIDVFEAANPDITVLRSDLVPDGEPNWNVSIGTLCNQFRIFEMAATNAGADLTEESFLEGVAEIGEFELVGQGTGFLGPDIFDAASALRLVEFDVDDLPDGGSKPFGPLVTLAELGIG